MTLTEFLLARIAEDEAVALAAVGTAAFQKQTGEWVFEHVNIPNHQDIPIVFAVADGGKTQAANMQAAWESDERGAHIARHDPARVLAECEAKRQIIVQAEEASRDRGQVIGEFCCGAAEEDEAWATDPGDLILRALALPYAAHPDYDEEWRP